MNDLQALNERVTAALESQDRAATMKCAEKIPGATGLYFLSKAPDAGLSGPSFVGRIIGMEGGFYIAQRIIHGIGPHVTLGEVKLFAPGDLYGEHVALYRTAEELDQAFFAYWQQWRNETDRIKREEAMRAGLKGEALREYMGTEIRGASILDAQERASREQGDD